MRRRGSGRRENLRVKINLLTSPEHALPFPQSGRGQKSARSSNRGIENLRNEDSLPRSPHLLSRLGRTDTFQWLSCQPLAARPPWVPARRTSYAAQGIAAAAP